MNERTENVSPVGDEDKLPLSDVWGLACVTNVREKRIPTPDLMRQELLAVVKYWAHVDLDTRFFLFTYGQYSSRQYRESVLARHRIDELAKCLGEQVVTEAVSITTDEFRATCDPRAWDIFINGDEEQVRAYQDGVWAR